MPTSRTAEGAASAACDVLCLPHAGGSVRMYREWMRIAPPSLAVVPVALPSAELSEGGVPAIGRELAERWAREPRYCEGSSFALFGHSLGAWVAYEAARALRDVGGPAPRALFVAACRAPDRPSPVYRRLVRADDATVIADLGLDQGPAAALLASGMREPFLGRLRRQLELAVAYRATAAEPLDVPLVALYGRSDPIADRRSMEAWRQYTRGPTAIHEYAGDHYFPYGAGEAVLELVASQLVTAPPSRDRRNGSRRSCTTRAPRVDAA